MGHGGGGAQAPVALRPSASRDTRPPPSPRRARPARATHPALPPSLSPPPPSYCNMMDEITYWIYTKRAPCLMGYDSLMKKPVDAAHCSKDKLRPVAEDMPSPKKRKKRKLSVLDESDSTEKQQNVYFEVSQNRSKPAVDSCDSDSVGSDVDFNIKNTDKKKRAKLQRNNRGVLHKKNKIVTSTPKSTVHLRRSLRQQKLNNSLLNTSYDVYNISEVNGVAKHGTNTNLALVKHEPYVNGEQNDKKINLKPRNKYTTLQNGEYGDMSDVSGFTATYIRSTKIQSNKTPKKLRSKNLTKHLQSPPQNDSNMLVCINKSTNTGNPNSNILNCSTDSSQNVINLVTIKSSNKLEQTDKTTSLLKFMDCKKSREALNKTDKQKKANLNISFQSQSSRNSRYPKRNRNNTNTVNNATDERKGTTNFIEYNNSDKKENPDDKLVSRTRSGRIPGLSICQRENSVLVISNSAEQVNSMVSMNVASPTTTEKTKIKTRQISKRSLKGRRSSKKDSLRDKSGFAQCFSESDDDSLPLVQRKYFCA